MPLERLLRRALKAIFGHNMRHSTEDLYKEAAIHGILPVRTLYYRATCILAFKIHNGTTESNLRLVRNLNRHTRVSSVFVVPHSRTGYGDRRFSYAASRMGNLLPALFDTSTVRSVVSVKKLFVRKITDDTVVNVALMNGDLWPF